MPRTFPTNITLADPFITPQIIVLANDQSYSSAPGTPVAATGLEFTPVANAVYFVEFFGIYFTAAVTTGFRWTFSEPTGCDWSGGDLRSVNSNTQNAAREGPTGTVVTGTGSGTTGPEPCWGWALVRTGSSPSGTFKVLFETEVNGSAVTLKSGSFIRYRRIV